MGRSKGRGSALDRLAEDESARPNADELAEPNPGPAAKFGVAQSLIAVPMLKEDELIGALCDLNRTDVRPFTDKQIELVTNFANQAVIAIENTAASQRTAPAYRDLRESLEQQTATSEVLQGHLKFAR